jgi:hypothetical protein
MSFGGFALAAAVAAVIGILAYGLIGPSQGDPAKAHIEQRVTAARP